MLNRILWGVAFALLLLNFLNRVEISIDCIECGRPCHSESILCRFAAQWRTDFAHYECPEWE